MSECQAASDGGVIFSDEAYVVVVKQLKEALSQTENLKQERHNLRRQLDVATKNAIHSGDELNDVQGQLKQQEEKATLQLRKMEEKHRLASALLTEKVETLDELLEKEKLDHQKAVTQLKWQLSIAKEDTQVQPNVIEVQELQNLKVLNADMEVALIETDRITVQLRLDKEDFLKQNEMLMEEKCELQQALASKREELTSCVQHLTVAKEELAMLHHELEMFKVTPDRLDKKGNSVFAEVEDNRQALKRNLDSLVVKYRSLKKELNKKKLEVNTLKVENITLHKKIQDVQTNFSCESHLISSYMERIKDLESSLKAQKEEKISVKFIKNDSAGLEWMESMLHSKSKEVEALKAKLEEQSVNHMMRSEALYRTDRDLKVAQAQVLQLKSEVSMLKQLPDVKHAMLSPDEMKSDREVIKENAVPQNQRFSTDAVPYKCSRLYSEQMESSVPSKICRFSADTVEPSTAKPKCMSKGNPFAYKKLVISSPAQVWKHSN